MTESGIVDKLNVVLYYADEMGNIITSTAGDG
jgi:hypothetical protein